MLETLNQFEKIKALILGLLLSLILAFLLPASGFLYTKLFFPLLGESLYLKMSLFPLLSVGLFLSIHSQWEWKKEGVSFFLYSTPLPLLLSFLFGALTKAHSEPLSHSTLFWYLFCIPIGEEFLFRGWAFELFERSFFQKNFASLLPLPVSIWMTSLMFSLWHLQNVGKDPLPLVLFQVFYTFFTGFWLGHLKLSSGNPLPCVLAHSLLNLASLLPYGL